MAPNSKYLLSRVAPECAHSNGPLVLFQRHTSLTPSKESDKHRASVRARARELLPSRFKYLALYFQSFPRYNSLFYGQRTESRFSLQITIDSVQISIILYAKYAVRRYVCCLSKTTAGTTSNWHLFVELGMWNIFSKTANF